MIPSQSLLLSCLIALTGQNGLYLAGGTIAGFLLCLAISVGALAVAIVNQKEDDN